MADGFGPDGQDPRDGSQQNNTYHYTYNYSYGSGRGTTPPGGNRPAVHPAFLVLQGHRCDLAAEQAGQDNRQR